MEERPPLKRWQRRMRVQEIRELAEAQLSAQAAEFDYRGLLAELHGLDRGFRPVADLEARIILLVAERRRPARLRTLLGMLRTRRLEADEAAEFEAFEDMLKAHLGADHVIGHGFAPETFLSVDHDMVWRNVGDLVARLQGLSKGVFLNSGTLLGVTRDGRLIDHDDDIDLGFCLNAGCEADAAAEWVALRRTLEEMGVLDYEAESPPIYKLKSDGGYEIDLFPCWIERGRVHVFPHTHGELAEADVFPTRPCAVTGLPVPARPENMLAVNYGAGWRAPDPISASTGKPRWSASPC
ncbi:MAG: hypothetical protein R3D85_11245 [Paracoccaceae bacterium]